MTNSPIRLTIIGGFLGAGKTTLVNHILRHAPDRRIAVLVNDFGAINIDAELIAACDAENITLANGRICCGLGNDLVRALCGVLAQEVRPEHLIIEASGVAEPWRIAELALAAPEFHRARTIVLADAEAIRDQTHDPYVGDLAQSQIDCADLLVLNKIDLLQPVERELVINWLRTASPATRIVAAERARIALDLIGLDDITLPRRHATRAVVPDAARSFSTFRFETQQPFDRVRLAASMAQMPPGVLRLKGIVRIEGEPCAQVLQAAGKRWDCVPHKRPYPADAPSRIVAIGTLDSADEASFHRLLVAALQAVT